MCETCNGKGRIDDKTSCEVCKGTGVIATEIPVAFSPEPVVETVAEEVPVELEVNHQVDEPKDESDRAESEAPIEEEARPV